MVEDVFGGQFQHTNYNQVEHEEEPNREAKDFFEMLQEAVVPIHIGVTTTVLQWVSQLLSNKILCKITNFGCEKIIQHAHTLLSPAGRHKLPDSMYSVKRFMRKLGLGYKTFDVCVNNCFLFYGEFESDSWTACPECGESRYEPSQIKKKFIARKKLWYSPLTPRLQRLYMSRNTAEHMTWHTKCRRDTDLMIHPASGEAWKSFDATYPDFAAESRNVRVGICTDGFNPFRNSSTPYSCWLVFVTPYNLLPDLCMRQEYIFLSLLISGPKIPGKNIDVLLPPLIDELKLLWDSGVQIYDSHRKENFQMRVAVMWTISDYQAMASYPSGVHMVDCLVPIMWSTLND